jgi:membrane-bound metal-dependent hydrolase YbcI (DUF457 family)
MALGYFSGIPFKKITGKNFNLIGIWKFSLLPDLDLLIPGLLHRGPTHSAVLALFVLVIALFLYRDGVPYIISLLSHSLIGDYFTANGCQILWPINAAWFKYEYTLSPNGSTLFYLEAFLFIVMLVFMAVERSGINFYGARDYSLIQ